MARSSRPPDGPSLFDLPLTDEPEIELDELDLGPAPPPRGTPTHRAGRVPATPAAIAPRPAAVAEARPAGFGTRLKAGLADLLLLLAAGVAVLVGAFLLGSRPGTGSWPPFAVFLFVFSFVYAAVPLAFWGATPGMVLAGLVCRTAEGHSLSFGQTVRRWLGGVLTLALLGLPVVLFAFSRASFVDRLSGSRTYRA